MRKPNKFQAVHKPKMFKIDSIKIKAKITPKTIPLTVENDLFFFIKSPPWQYYSIKTAKGQELVKYLPCGKCEIIRFANCEIFCCQKVK